MRQLFNRNSVTANRTVVDEASQSEGIFSTKIWPDHAAGSPADVDHARNLQVIVENKIIWL